MDVLDPVVVACGSDFEEEEAAGVDPVVVAVAEVEPVGHAERERGRRARPALPSRGTFGAWILEAPNMNQQHPAPPPLRFRSRPPRGVAW